MKSIQRPGRFNRSIQAIGSFISGGAFPVFAISLLACWEVFLIGVLLVPPSPTALGAFAEDFRVWCFGYDPATGRTEWAYVFSMLLPQLMVGGFIALFWWKPLREMLREPKRAAAHVGAAALIVAGRVEDLRSGVAEAGEAIDSGAAATALAKLVAITNEGAA